MRLLTYNIHKGIGGRDRRYSLQRIIEVIEGQNPDLVCLQEVTRGAPRCRHDDQPRLLAKYFGSLGSVFQQNVTYRQGGYGNLILTRWPQSSAHRVSLRMKQKKPRGAVLTIVDTPEGPLHLVTCHLGLAERERQWQIGHLLSHRLFCESLHLPTLIAGDLNDWRNTLAGAALREHDFEHVSHPMSRYRSFPAWLPAGSLDKAFCRGAIAVRRAHVVHSALARSASDHLPLVVDFHLDNV